MTGRATTTSVAELEKHVLLDALYAHLGTSSTQLVLSTIGGVDRYPVREHPYDKYDVEGLTQTLESLPDELRERAQAVYDEQIRLYKYHSFDYEKGRRIR